jgi:hypothetical protein
MRDLNRTHGRLRRICHALAIPRIAAPTLRVAFNACCRQLTGREKEACRRSRPDVSNAMFYCGGISENRLARRCRQQKLRPCSAGWDGGLCASPSRIVFVGAPDLPFAERVAIMRQLCKASEGSRAAQRWPACGRARADDAPFFTGRNFAPGRTRPIDPHLVATAAIRRAAAGASRFDREIKCTETETVNCRVCACAGLFVEIDACYARVSVFLFWQVFWVNDD